MRLSFLLISFICLFTNGFSQSPEPAQRTGRSKQLIYSSSSDWQRVTFKPTPLLHPSAPATPAKRSTRPLAPASAQRSESRQPGTVTDAVSPPATGQTGSLATAQSSVNAQPASQPDVATEPAPTRRRTPIVPNATGYHPGFTGDFSTNRNGWKAGNKGDYNYQIGLGKYNIRKRNVYTNQVAFSYVQLPADINLNVAETFTIKVDVVADSGRVPTGGILFGVADSLNYSGFSLNSKGEISIIRVVNGQTSDDYMPGEYFKPGILLEKNRDRLIIRRDGEALHFYINDQEVRSSPYPFRMFAGNGIGLTTTGYWTSFQKLTITLGQ
jgi:hypothetical protein